jgi:hypothetical protein
MEALTAATLLKAALAAMPPSVSISTEAMGILAESEQKVLTVCPVDTKGWFSDYNCLLEKVVEVAARAAAVGVAVAVGAAAAAAVVVVVVAAARALVATTGAMVVTEATAAKAVVVDRAAEARQAGMAAAAAARSRFVPWAAYRFLETSP